MPSRARLEWHGDELIARVERAARAAVNEVIEEAAADARTSHNWKNRTMQLEEEIGTEPAHLVKDRIVARFGTTRRRGFYGLFHEEGTVHEFARPFLRPAADRTFPSLAERIWRKLHGGT